MNIPRRLIYIFSALAVTFLVGYLIYTGTHIIPAEAEESPSEEIEYEESD